MSYVIHGASGAQGGPLYQRLLASGKEAVAAVRDPAGFAGKPAVALDNGSVASLVAAYRDADGVFVHLPQVGEPGRVQHATNIAEAIKLAKPKRVVISTNGAVVDQPGTALQAAAESAIIVLLDGVKASGVSHAVIAPRLYLENLLLPMVIQPAMAEGVLRYPLQAGFPVSWCSHLDVADVAERLLQDMSVTGVVGVGQLPGLKGADLAAGFAEHLGRTVGFETVTPQAFGKSIEPIVGPAAAAGVADFYQALLQASANVIAEGTSAQRLLGITPRSVRQWLAESLT
jgi:uncharacterized protein YbjT (DUF2867 family)